MSKNIEDSEDEQDGGIAIDSNKMAKDAQKKAYEEKITHIGQTFKRIFINSEKFYSRQKTAQYLCICCQLLTSMAFNGAFDIPILIFILILQMIYTFRKRYYVFYQSFVIFIMYYIYYASLLKLFYMVIKSIPYISKYMANNKDVTWVAVCDILFGLNTKAKGMKLSTFGFNSGNSTTTPDAAGAAFGAFTSGLG